jgi:hypothetical protein
MITRALRGRAAGSGSHQLAFRGRRDPPVKPGLQRVDDLSGGALAHLVVDLDRLAGIRHSLYCQPRKQSKLWPEQVRMDNLGGIEVLWKRRAVGPDPGLTLQ